MQRYVQLYFAILIAITGLSHAAQPRLWAEFFVAMKRTGLASIIIPLYTLPLSVLLIVTHNKWVWDWPVFVTISGWGMTTKSVVYWVFPAWPNRMIDNAERWQARFGGFRVVGIVMGILGAIVAWDALRAWGGWPGAS
jgi:hypothetical protein